MISKTILNTHTKEPLRNEGEIMYLYQKIPSHGHTALCPCCKTAKKVKETTLLIELTNEFDEKIEKGLKIPFCNTCNVPFVTSKIITKINDTYDGYKIATFDVSKVKKKSDIKNRVVKTNQTIQTEDKTEDISDIVPETNAVEVEETQEHPVSNQDNEISIEQVEEIQDDCISDQVDEISLVQSKKTKDNSSSKKGSETIKQSTRTFLGFMSIVGKSGYNSGFYNFNVRREYIDGQFIDNKNIEELFPTRRNFNVYCDIRKKLEKFTHNAWYIISLNMDDLEENINPYTYQRYDTIYKISVEKIYVTDIYKEDIYKVAKTIEPVIDFSKDKQIFIHGAKDQSFYKNEPVLIEYNEFLYGPMMVDCREFEEKYYVTNETVKTGIVKYFGKYQSDFIFTHGLNTDRYDNDFQYRLVRTNKDSQQEQDVTTDESLLEQFSTTMKRTKSMNGSVLSFSNLEETIEIYKSSVFSKKTPQAVQENRIMRLQKILSNVVEADEHSESIQNIVRSIIYKEDSGENPKFKEFLAKYIPEIHQETQSESLPKMQDEVPSPTKEAPRGHENTRGKKEEVGVVSYPEDNDILLETLKTIEDLENLKKEQRYRIADVEELKQEEVDLKKRVENDRSALEHKVEMAIVNGIAAAKNNPEKIAFDGMLANKLMEAAATWDIQNTENRYDEIIAYHNEMESLGNDVNLCDYLVKQIQIVRPNYEYNDILNILLCIRLGFLTVFSGEPGTGKTSICNIIGDVLGLTNMNRRANMDHEDIEALTGYTLNRYISISVERGWTSKKDFLGYYNPLTKTFDKNNRTMFDAFHIMEKEHKTEDTTHVMPYIVLLDEANLSPLEYYWGDFMKCADGDNDANMWINLGEDYQFKVYDNLRFVATINNDHTTEELSPRLIDRAWTITLPKTKYTFGGRKNIVSSISKDVKCVSWEQFENAFSMTKSSNEQLTEETTTKLTSLQKCFESLHIDVSYRVWRDVENYILIGKDMFKIDDKGRSPEIIALDYAVAQKLLPKIKFGLEYSEQFEYLRYICSKKEKFNKCFELLDTIDKKSATTHYYDFFC